MRMAMIGLGKTGGNMPCRLCRNGIEVVGYGRTAGIAEQIAREDGMIPAGSVQDAVSQLDPPRMLWPALPCGDPAAQQRHERLPRFSKGDIVIGGGNSNYRLPSMMRNAFGGHAMQALS